MGEDAAPDLCCFCRAANPSSRSTKTGEGLSTGYAFLHQAPDGAIWLSDDQGLRRVAEDVECFR